MVRWLEAFTLTLVFCLAYAIWVEVRPDLDRDQIALLREEVRLLNEQISGVNRNLNNLGIHYKVTIKEKK